MRNFNRDRRDRDRRGGGRRDDGPREMHDAVCDECGRDCQVPFRPSGGKPVLCSNCFEKSGNGGRDRSRGRDDRRGGRDDRRGGRDDRRSNSRDDRRMFDAHCDDCRRECQVPFKPSPGKSVYCDRCFAKHSKNGAEFNDSPTPAGADYKKEFEVLNAKVDMILEILNGLVEMDEEDDMEEEVVDSDGVDVEEQVDEEEEIVG